MELILHIGGEKTGTTSLQRFLFENSVELFQATKIFYPTSPSLCQYDGHFPVAAAFLPPGSLEFLDASKALSLDILQQEIRQIALTEKPEAILFSAEHFSSRMKKDEIFQLSRWFRTSGLFDRYRIVFYVRPQDELFVSALSTALLAGRNAWNTSHVVSPQSHYYNHLATAELWELQFGIKSMVVRAYGSSSGDIVTDFLSAIGADFTPKTMSERSNEGFGYEGMRLIYLINRYLPEWDGETTASSRGDSLSAQALRNAIAEVIRNTGIFGDGPAGLRVMPAQARERIRADFAPHNARLNEKYGSNLTFRAYDDKRPDMELPSDEDILARSAIALGKALLAKD
ncbi:MAG: hypothetical protein HY245_05890 [Rhizobiales bacterium]|nr:hypothetical protein [Hyphomicrobiales bacterium]MBI3672939.1 hypothetical protein [Hyphomicrobiales bacterium]